MSDFVIIPDSTCDLTQDLRQRFGIDDYVPAQLTYPDGHCEEVELEWQTISKEEFFNIIGDKKMFFKTAQPKHETVKRVFEKYLSAGKDVLGITISASMSGTYGAYVTAAEELRRQYPDRKIVCLDSLRYSAGMALLCMRADQLRAEGLSIDETAERLLTERKKIHQMGVLDDLYFCKKMGRVSSTAAVMGTIVGIKPMADFDNTGMSHPIGKVRGYKAAYRTAVNYIRETITDPENAVVIVMHSARAEEAEKLASAIREGIAPREIVMMHVGKSCGPNIGPGLIAAYYFGTEISDDMARETAIFEKASQAK